MSALQPLKSWTTSSTLFILAFVFGTGTANADSFTSSYGQATCQTNQDTHNGRTLEFYGEVNESTDNATVGFKYIIEFQKPIPRDTCRNVQYLAERRMRLDIQKQELELELLRRKVYAEEEEDSSPALPEEW